MKRDQIEAVVVSLKADEEGLLFVLLSQDGTVNRMGDGRMNSSDRDMYIGRTEEPLFRSLCDKIDDELLNNPGGYELPDRVGADCMLTFGFESGSGKGESVQFRYGSESEGPPLEACNFLRAALEVTDGWHSSQKRMVSKSSKPWWRFW